MVTRTPPEIGPVWGSTQSGLGIHNSSFVGVGVGVSVYGVGEGEGEEVGSPGSFGGRGGKPPLKKVHGLRPLAHPFAMCERCCGSQS